MRDLTLSECAWISGAELDEGSKALLIAGTTLGLLGGAIGFSFGATHYGSIGGIGCGLIGIVTGSVGIPLLILGTGIFVGVVYQSIGVIDLHKKESN